MKVQFATTIYSKDAEHGYRDYLINYLPPKKKMEVIQQIKVVADDPECPWMHFGLKQSLYISYESLILTPQNVDTRLPTLLTFS